MQAWPQIRSDDQAMSMSSGSIPGRRRQHLFPGLGRFWPDLAGGAAREGRGGDVEGPMEMAADDQGHLYIAWADNRDGEYGIYLVASTDHGRTWSKDVRLDVAKAKASRASFPTWPLIPRGMCTWSGRMLGTGVGYLPQHVLGLREDLAPRGGPDQRRARRRGRGAAPSDRRRRERAIAVAWQEDRGHDQQEGSTSPGRPTSERHGSTRTSAQTSRNLGRLPSGHRSPCFRMEPLSSPGKSLGKMVKISS